MKKNISQASVLSLPNLQNLSNWKHMQVACAHMGKNSHAKEGELPSGESQIDFLSFGVATSMGLWLIIVVQN